MNLHHIRQGLAEVREQIFAEAFVRLGYGKSEHIDAALREQALQTPATHLQLGQILIQKGWLSAAQYVEILKTLDRDLLQCPTCGQTSVIRGRAASDVVNCLGCGGELTVPADHPVTSSPKNRLGRYEIERELARGGMGIVFKGFDPDLRRPIALKVIKDDPDNPGNIARLRREACASARLRHPSIVGIHEIGISAGRHYIAMDFIEGTTLRHSIGTKKIPPRQAAELLEKVALAVHHAHEQGVVHRDLKPENILIDASGQPLVTDFGLARIEGSSMRLTRSGDMMGTPIYMSPEQILADAAEIGPRSDVYALGVMLYELLTGRPPYLGDNFLQLYPNILEGIPPVPASLRPGLPEDIANVAMKAMAVASRNRYPTARSFAEDVRRFIDGEPVAASAYSNFERLRRKVKRHWPLILMTGAACIALSIGLYYATAHRRLEEGSRKKLEETIGNLERLANQAIEKYDNALLGTARPLTQECADLEESLSFLQRLYRDNPSAHEALVYIGKIHLRLGRNDKARAAMTEGLERLGARGAGRYYLERGMLWVQLFSELQLRVEGLPRRKWEAESIKLIASAKSDFDEAKRRGDVMTPARSRHIEAISALLIRDWDGCRGICEKLIADPATADAQRADAYRLKGDCLRDSDPFEAAIAYAAAAEIRRCDKVALFSAAYALKSSIRGSDIKIALEFAERALKIDPKWAAPWLAKGILWTNIGREQLERWDDPTPSFEESEKSFRKAEELAPDDPMIRAEWSGLHYARGFWLTKKGEAPDREIEAALNDAETALGMASDFRVAIYNRATARTLAVHAAVGDRVANAEAALEDLDRLVEGYPSDFGPLVDRVGLRIQKLHALKGKLDEQDQCFRQGLEDVDRAIAWRTAYSQGHHLRGNLHYFKCYYHALAGAAVATKDLDEAEKSFTAALKVEPDRDSALIDRGILFMTRWDLQHEPEFLTRSIADLRAAVGLNPKNGLAHGSLALGLLRAKQYREAASEFEKGFELLPWMRAQHRADYDECRRQLGPEGR